MKKSIFNFNAIPKKNHLNFKASNNFISSSQRETFAKENRFNYASN